MDSFSWVLVVLILNLSGVLLIELNNFMGWITETIIAMRKPLFTFVLCWRAAKLMIDSVTSIVALIIVFESVVWR